MARHKFAAATKAVFEEQASSMRLDLRHFDSPEVSLKPMFGGQGLYLVGRFFGLLYEGRLFFRTDATSRAYYLAYGMTPLQSTCGARRAVEGRYYEVPSEILVNPSLLGKWATRAADTAR